MSRDYIQFPVPVEFVSEVTAFVAKLEAGARQRIAEPANPWSDDGHLSGSSATAKGDRGIVWTPGQYHWLNLSDTVSAARVRKMMDRLTFMEDIPQMSLIELAQMSGLKDTQVRHALSWLTKFLKDNPDKFPEARWPFGWAYGREVAADDPYGFYYSMSQEQREAWNAVAVNADDD